MVPEARPSIVSASQSLPIPKFKSPWAIPEPVVDHCALRVVHFLTMLVLDTIFSLPPCICVVISAANLQPISVPPTTSFQISFVIAIQIRDFFTRFAAARPAIFKVTRLPLKAVQPDDDMATLGTFTEFRFKKFFS